MVIVVLVLDVSWHVAPHHGMSTSLGPLVLRGLAETSSNVVFILPITCAYQHMQCISMLYNKFNATPHHSVASCLLLSKLSSCRLIWICWIWAANTWHRNVGDVAQTWPTTCACDIYNQLERTWLLMAHWLSWIAGPTLGIFFHSLTELTLMFLKKCATLCFQNLDFRKTTWSNVEPKSCRAGYLYGANAKQCSIESYWIYMCVYIIYIRIIYVYISIVTYCGHLRRPKWGHVWGWSAYRCKSRNRFSIIFQLYRLKVVDLS